MLKITPVILCGGSGTRLWPLSRALMPKQLLPLTGPRSLLQEAALRARMAGTGDTVLVICNESHRFLVERQLREMAIAPTLVLEPEARSTAPAVALAALLAARRSGAGTLLLVLPSDHVITDPRRFVEAVTLGEAAALDGALVTFGIVPDRPETGYGYIRPGHGDGLRPVEQFVEKPDLSRAREYVESGRYLWNSGMFLFTAQSYLAELERFAPDILAACRLALDSGDTSGAAVLPDRDAFLAARAISVDGAVMEKTRRAMVVTLDAGWSDIGSWAAVHEVSAADADGNSISGDVLALECRNSYLRAESRLVAAVGLDGCVVVETKDAVVVVPGGRVQDVKKLADELSARHRAEAVHGREVFRPWGSYDSLEAARGYQVKRLAVLPGAALSLQLHRQRAEHWVVVSGLARITRDEEVFELRRNEHSFIPPGMPHRIENPGTELLEIIEVQLGDYLGEDDIVRLEDRYGRAGRTD